MAACIYCGRETGLPTPDTCNSCHDLIAHLTRFMGSQRGRHLVANALSEHRNAALDGNTVEELEARVAEIQQMMGRSNGGLYPAIMASEIQVIEEAIRRKRT